MAGLLFIFSVAILPLTLLSAHTDAGVTKEGQRKAPGLGVILHHNERHFPSLPDVVSSYPLKGGSDDITTTRNSAPSLREKRFADGSYVPILSKRIREFVGKRSSGGLFSRQFREQPTLEDKARYLEYVVPFIYVTYNTYLSTADLARQSVGGASTNGDLMDPSDQSEDETSTGGDLTDPSDLRFAETWEPTIAKRVNEFVRKRDDDGLAEERNRESAKRKFANSFWEFVGKRAGRFWNFQPDSVTLQPSFIVTDKRFIGRRGSPSNSGSVDKRIREFVGKRDSLSMDRRIREFVGKRDSLSLNKRIREFVGKRDSLSLDKRIREFVGKRDSLSMDKRIREFVGKRDSLDKRIREFVGKRNSFFTDKRIREFVGKRNSLDKRIREFVGKRNSLDKRIREFVGKRGSFSMDKRIREFVGKRGSLSMDKRIREFVGKRGLEEFIKSAAPVLRDCGRLCGEEESSVRVDILQLGQNGATNPDDPNLLIREEPIFPAKLEQLLNKRIREFVEKRSQEPDKVFVPHIPDTGTREESFVDIRDILDYLSNMEKLIPEFDREREKPVMQRNRDFVDLDFHKRIREFVGKRDQSNLDRNRPIHGLVSLRDLPDLDINKRIREFVGKRDQPEADFGKRLKELLKEGSLPTTDINKRLHEFLEKRDSSEFEINKRIREFVGK